jgi:hypothetical protein
MFIVVSCKKHSLCIDDTFAGLLEFIEGVAGTGGGIQIFQNTNRSDAQIFGGQVSDRKEDAQACGIDNSGKILLTPLYPDNFGFYANSSFVKCV